MKKFVNDALSARVNTIVARHSARARQDVRNAGTKSGYRFVNKDEAADLFLYGEISEWWGISATDFVRDLQEIDAKSINLYVNSVGGSVFSGFAIYSSLVRHSEEKGITINVVIDGVAASIASVIAMSGDTIKIYEQATMMVHEPWSYAVGSASDLREEAEVLDVLKDAIIDVYESRTGGDRAEITKWVEDETWMKGKVAVDRGFADEIVPLKAKKKEDTEDSTPLAAMADADYLTSIFRNIPSDTVAALSKQPPRMVQVGGLLVNADDTAAGYIQSDKIPPKTTRELARALRDIGYSRDAADSIAAHGFKQKDKPRDAAPLPGEPTTTDPRDGAAERDEAVKAIKAFANAAAIKAAVLTLTR